MPRSDHSGEEPFHEDRLGPRIVLARSGRIVGKREVDGRRDARSAQVPVCAPPGIGPELLHALRHIAVDPATMFVAYRGAPVSAGRTVSP
jgi:hypothetical protein